MPRYSCNQTLLIPVMMLSHAHGASDLFSSPCISVYAIYRTSPSALTIPAWLHPPFLLLLLRWEDRWRGRGELMRNGSRLCYYELVFVAY